MDRTEAPVALLPLLSFNGGYVDAAGFFALQGLFTAHVTGNFVTVGATLLFGTTGVVAKLLALPIFCVAVFLVRLGNGNGRLGLVGLLTLKLLLLVIGGGLAVTLHPPAGDSWQLLVIAATFISAMAIQNSVQRIYFPTAPATTVMTGAMTQIVLDLADAARRKRDPLRHRRLLSTAANVATFALGCAAAAVLFGQLHMWCFVVPPIFGLAALVTTAEVRR